MNADNRGKDLYGHGAWGIEQVEKTERKEEVDGTYGDRAAGRMQARQTYRTMARMQRRRSYVEDRLGVREDFSSPRDQPAAQSAEPTPSPAASEPDYVSELERLAQLRDQGIITDEEFEAKKKQILGIQNARCGRRRVVPLVDRS